MTLSDLWPTFQGYDNVQRQITRLIVSRIWSIQWFRFQWPWVTLNLHLMSAKILTSRESGCMVAHNRQVVRTPGRRLWNGRDQWHPASAKRYAECASDLCHTCEIRPTLVTLQSLSPDAAKTLVQAFISSRLDSVLYAVTDNLHVLQRLQSDQIFYLPKVNKE